MASSPARRGAEQDAMTLVVFQKLLAILLAIGLGYVAGRARWLGDDQPVVARVLGNIAFTVFVPALLFRTTARLDLGTLPWRTVSAFFVPALAVLFASYAWSRGERERHGPSAAAVRAISTSFGNSVQLGIPFAAALFGEAGLGIHIALVSLHALVLLSVATTLAELDIAHAHAAHAGARSVAHTLGLTLRNTVLHPVILPVLAGLAWNFTGLGLHSVADEVLVMLSDAVVPVCLVLIGVTLAAYGVRGRVRAAIGVTAVKLLVLPALVLVVAHWVFGLAGTPLAVVVMLGAMPVGSNALILAQRYRTLEAEATAAIVLSTFAFAATATLWLGVLAWLAR